MNKRTWSMALVVAGSLAYIFPTWQGMFMDSSDVSTGEGRAIATILLVGGLILWYLPENTGNGN